MLRAPKSIPVVLALSALWALLTALPRTAWAREPGEIFTRAAPATVVIVARGGGGVSIGSGVIIEASGQVVTNKHVIANALAGGRIMGFLFDPSEKRSDEGFDEYLEHHADRAQPMKVRQLSATSDLALLSLPSLPMGRRYPTVEIGDTDKLHIGDDVFAIGAPQGLTWSLSPGIVSALRKSSIQTSAPINSGNSGGPLLDRSGRLVGINTYIRREGQGLSFALPVEMIADLTRAAPPSPQASAAPRVPAGSTKPSTTPPSAPASAPSTGAAPATSPPTAAAPDSTPPTEADRTPAPSGEASPWAPGKYMRQAISTVITNAVSASEGSSYGFDDDFSVLASFLKVGAEVSIWRKLRAGQSYAFIGGGDGDASDVDIYLSDGDGNVLAADRDDDASPLVKFKPPTDGLYKLTLRLERGAQDSFCALVTLRTGGFEVPLENLSTVIERMARQGAQVHDKVEGASFHSTPNSWSLYGAVLRPRTKITVEHVKLEARRHVVFAVADGMAKDIDLRMEKSGGDPLAEDKDDDATPIVAARTDDTDCRLVLSNQDSNGPSLAMMSVLDVVDDSAPSSDPTPAPAPTSAWRPGANMHEAVAQVVGGAINVMSRDRYGLLGGTSLVGAYLATGKKVSMRIPLVAGQRYVIIGGGGGGAKNVDLVVQDPAGKVEAADKDEDASPVAEFVPAVSGQHRIEMTLATVTDGTTGSFCAFVVLQKNGGFRTSVAALDAALGRVIDIGARIDQKSGGAHFHDEANQNALFGMVLESGGSVELTGLWMEEGRHAALGSAEDTTANIDLVLRDGAGTVLDSDVEPDSVPVAIAKTHGAPYRLEVLNKKSTTPQFVVVTLLDIEHP